jgi:succinyl-CoA synthetase beta subunit
MKENPDIKCVFINIFGGILRCDILAKELIYSLKTIEGINKPLVLRMKGTNVEGAIKYL